MKMHGKSVLIHKNLRLFSSDLSNWPGIHCPSSNMAAVCSGDGMQCNKDATADHYKCPDKWIGCIYNSNLKIVLTCVYI